MAEVETVQEAYASYRELSQEDKQTFRQVVDDIRLEMPTALDQRAGTREWLAGQGHEIPSVVRSALEAVIVRGDKGPNVGEEAPDFCLNKLGGEGKVQLSGFQGQQPVGLVFGSYT